MANGGGVQLFEQRFQQPEDRNIKAMGGVDVYNIASSSTKTKFQPSSSLTGGSEGKHYTAYTACPPETFFHIFNKVISKEGNIMAEPEQPFQTLCLLENVSAQTKKGCCIPFRQMHL